MAHNAFKSHKKHRHTFTEQVDRLMALTAISNGEPNELNPHVFAVSANPIILNHRDAMKVDDSEHFLASMDDLMKNLLHNDIYEIVPRSQVPAAQRVLRTVWSHRRKQKPYGTIYCHRSRICADGSQQQFGIDYTNTYAPVVNWTTVRILLILSVLLDLKSQQVDYVQAFPQATLPEGEHIYMDIPAGYHYDGPTSGDHVLRLKKNLYGLKLAAYNWREMLR
jgi:hypothetical protein